MPGTFSPPPRSCDPDMHHGTCVTHVPWCMPGSLTSGFLWSRWRGKRSRHSRRMRNPQFYVSGKKPIGLLSAFHFPQDSLWFDRRMMFQLMFLSAGNCLPVKFTLSYISAPTQPEDTGKYMTDVFWCNSLLWCLHFIIYILLLDLHIFLWKKHWHTVSPWRNMATQITVIIGSGIGLLPDSTKALHGMMFPVEFEPTTSQYNIERSNF